MPRSKPGSGTSAKLKRAQTKTQKQKKSKSDISKVKHSRKKSGSGLGTVPLSTLVAVGIDPTTALRVRPRRAVTMKQPPPRYIVDPQWGPSDAHTGASWMEVTIGPMQGGPGMYGSPPASNTPAVMRALLDGACNEFGWIAGHLLNDNLGGPGAAKNLTPLTTAGNKNHLSLCETRIKNFINAAYSRVMNYPADECYFGVYYKVVVGDTAWDDNDDDLQYVATELRVWAHVVKMHKMTGDVSPATQGECPISSWFAPIVNQAVDNTGYDQL